MFWIFGDVFGDVFPHAVVSRSDLMVRILAPEKREGKYELENDDKELSIGLRIELIK